MPITPLTALDPVLDIPKAGENYPEVHIQSKVDPDYSYSNIEPPTIKQHYRDQFLKKFNTETISMRFKDLCNMEECLYECPIKLKDYSFESLDKSIIEKIKTRESYIKGPIYNKSGDILYKRPVGLYPLSNKVKPSPSETRVSVSINENGFTATVFPANNPFYDVSITSTAEEIGHCIIKQKCEPKPPRNPVGPEIRQPKVRFADSIRT